MRAPPASAVHDYSLSMPTNWRLLTLVQNLRLWEKGQGLKKRTLSKLKENCLYFFLFFIAKTKQKVWWVDTVVPGWSSSLYLGHRHCRVNMSVSGFGDHWSDLMWNNVEIQIAYTKKAQQRKSQNNTLLPGGPWSLAFFTERRREKKPISPNVMKRILWLIRIIYS